MEKDNMSNNNGQREEQNKPKTSSTVPTRKEMYETLKARSLELQKGQGNKS